MRSPAIALHVSPPIPDTARVKTAPQTDALSLKLTAADGAAALNERRVARGIDGRERYIYCVQGVNPREGPTASATLEEAAHDVSDLEGRYISERND